MTARRFALAGLILLLAAVLVVVACTDQIVTAVMTPPAPFDQALVPRAPDYARDEAWLALPGTREDSDVALPGLPAIAPADAPVDVFYVHPTTSVAPRWNTAFDDPEVRQASFRGGTLIQASVFNGCCAVYAPTYRQATGLAFVTRTEDGVRAMDVAYGDVAAAFEEFLRRTGGARPFILAGHSQGSWLAARLLRERIGKDDAVRARLVAAYIIGGSIGAQDVLPLSACTSPAQTACVVAFDARGPGHQKGKFEFGTEVPEAGRLCVNPTLGAATTEAAPRARHGGAVFLDADHPALLPAFAASACVGGRLVVTERAAIPARDALSGVLMWILGGENLHPIEYQLFYADLRADAGRRAAAFISDPLRR